jgi:hypothetical protein
MRNLGYDDAAVVFLISRVGTSEVARVFVEGLGNDEYIGDTVYVSPADLQLKRAAFQNSGNDTAYTEMVSANKCILMNVWQKCANIHILIADSTLLGCFACSD